MTLIKSISGTRGTIGGASGSNLTALDLVDSTAAYAQLLLNSDAPKKVVLGRDARISGEIVSNIVASTLRMMGFDVVDLGLSTTPTVEVMVPKLEAGGGIILTASHNPKQWNALKFLNKKGEFISGAEGSEILRLSAENAIEYADTDLLGSYETYDTAIQEHIDAIFELPLVDLKTVKARNFKVVIDCVNSTGAISMVPLLEQMGCIVEVLYPDLSGRFAHNPEPLPENLSELCRMVTFHKADLGIAVDPDVDRLALVSEDGEVFGEEYTLVAIADYILTHTKGPTVSNLSSTKALKEVTEKHGCTYSASAVGEVNVVEEMKKVNAVIGGEGNGGVIYPALHSGRDAMVGIALFLSHLAAFGKSASFLRSTYPNYTISKNKVQLTPEINIDDLLKTLQKKYSSQEIVSIDGVKIFFDEDWIHLRRSNTEPILRIYAESTSEVMANNLANKIKADISEIMIQEL